MVASRWRLVLAVSVVRAQQLAVLELRVVGAGRLASRLVNASLAQRVQLEEEHSKAAAEAEALPAEEPTRRAAALGVLLKMAKGVEEHAADAARLLREPSTLDPQTLRKIAASTA